MSSTGTCSSKDEGSLTTLECLTKQEQSHVKVIDSNDEMVVLYKSKHPRANEVMQTTSLVSPVFLSTNKQTSCEEHHQRESKPDEAAGPSLGHFKYNANSTLRSLLQYKGLKLIQILCAFYVFLMTYVVPGLRDTETGLILDPQSHDRTSRGLILVNGTERPIVAATDLQVIFVGISRMSAWFMYPALVMVYVSKLRATTGFLQRTPLSMFLYTDLHELHIYCGWTILVCSLVHTAFHIFRWIDQGNLDLVYKHRSGITGLIIISSCLLICVPMTIFRKQIGYELRKRLHYLFVLFALALCFHTPTSAIPNGGFTAWVFGILLAWYFADNIYCFIWMTEKIETTNFKVLPSGVRMDMKVSSLFQHHGANGGYCYVCLPWVDPKQWHAFSLFENPADPTERQIFMQKNGDWTTDVHKMLQRNTVRPVWVSGPFPSPYNRAENYDNQILEASGIGITPALSMIRAYKDSRRINLIWACRDIHLLEFFLTHLYLDHDGWNCIFYTGKAKLPRKHIDLAADTNVCIISGRPQLKQLVPNIIYGIESGIGLPERYQPEARMTVSEMLVDRMYATMEDQTSSTESPQSSRDMTESLACYASELGFHLPEEAISKELEKVPSPASMTRRSSSTGRTKSLKRQRQASERRIMKELGLEFRPWESHPDASDYVKALDKRMVLSTWGILYCGGAKQVEEDLKKISVKYSIPIHIESFSW